MFNGHGDTGSTKDITHQRYSNGKLVNQCYLQKIQGLIKMKRDFLLNLKNKQCFLEMFTAEISFTVISASQSNGDHIVNSFNQFFLCI